jgi:hypothetical protein
MLKSHLSKPKPCAFAVALICGCFSIPAFSTPFYIVEKDILFLQNSTAAPVATNGSAVTLSVTTPGSFDGGTVNTPGSAGTKTLGPGLIFQSGLLPAGDNTFPKGLYTFNLTDSTNSANSATQTVDDTVENFPTAIPALTPASWTALQTIDPTAPFTFHFNSFTSPDAPLTFFDIQNLNDGTVPFSDGLQPNVTQDTIAANTLKVGVPYRFLIFFTDNIVTTNTQLQLTNRTQGRFTPGAATATPEPATVSTCLLGAIAMLGVARRRRS